MSRSRNMADLLDSNGDVKSGALDNVPPSNDASALTTGTLPVDRVPYLGRRNLIINGSMKVWQRGDNGHSGSNGYVSLDRFKATRIRIRKPNTNGNSGEDNRGAIFDCSDGNIYAHVDYYLEGTDLKHGEQYTLSFWAKTPNTSSQTLYLEHASTDYFDFGANHNIVLTSTWQKFTYTGTVVNTGSGRVLVMRWYVNPGNSGQPNVMVQVADVQLEVGSVATPFEHRSYGEELALCQRYYEKWEDTGWIMAHGYNLEVYTTIPYKVQKRTSSGNTYYSQNPPPVTMYGSSASSGGINSAITSLTATPLDNTHWTGYFTLNDSTYTTYGTNVMWRLNAGGNWIAYDAEL
jgi:hypothetical protein